MAKIEDELIENELIDTRWILRSSNSGSTKIEFIDLGVLLDDFKDSVHEWRVEDGAVILEYNDGFATYIGKLEGNTIIGMAGNIKGERWRFKAERIIEE